MSGHLFVLAIEAGHVVNASIGAASSPIERAMELLDSRSRAASLAYARIGTLRRAIEARQYLRGQLEPWHARGFCFRVPISDGEQFRGAINRTLGRFEIGGLPIRLHHVDMIEYLATQRRLSLRVKRHFKFGAGVHLVRTGH